MKNYVQLTQRYLVYVSKNEDLRHPHWKYSATSQKINSNNLQVTTKEKLELKAVNQVPAKPKYLH